MLNSISFLLQKGGGLSLVRNSSIYQAIKAENEQEYYLVSALCKLGCVSRAAYYKWPHREPFQNERLNKCVADEIEKSMKNPLIKDIGGSGIIWIGIKISR